MHFVGFDVLTAVADFQPITQRYILEDRTLLRTPRQIKLG
jgi:hypothetical protein